MGGSRVVETNGVGRSSRRSARGAGEDRTTQESKPDFSSNGSSRSLRSRFCRFSKIDSIAHEDPSATSVIDVYRARVMLLRFRYWYLLPTPGGPSTPPMFSTGDSNCAAKSHARFRLSILSKQWWFWWLLLPGCLASWANYIEEYDAIRVARCDVRCSRNYSDECMENCLASNYTKPGYCPSKASMSPFEAVCLLACNDDSRCPDLAKCCKHDCGVTCMYPMGLDNRSDLPVIPENVQIRQQKNNLVLLSWQNSKVEEPHESAAGIRYLVEERHLLGPRYLESRLSSWAVRHVSSKPHATLRERLKTGHWYQFRVAAINANGSRGYSLASRPFKTREPRSLKEPLNLTLSDARLSGGKLRIVLRWAKPSSDVPITFYKVFWSRLVHGPANDSVLVYHRTILKDKTCYELRNLELKCQYFLQVQAVALYGGRRLVSRKVSTVFNSTDYMAYAAPGRRSRRCERYNDGLHLRRMACHCGEVKVRLVWPVNHQVKAYNVSWREESCSASRERSVARQKKFLWKVVELPQLDIRHLRSECTHSVNVRNIFHGTNSEGHGARIEFYTIGCRKESADHGDSALSRNKMIRCKTSSTKRKRHYF